MSCICKTLELDNPN